MPGEGAVQVEGVQGPRGGMGAVAGEVSCHPQHERRACSIAYLHTPLGSGPLGEASLSSPGGRWQISVPCLLPDMMSLHQLWILHMSTRCGILTRVPAFLGASVSISLLRRQNHLRKAC
jgi:hypothetical protein